MKILHVIPSLAPCRGGASKAAIDMVTALRQQGVEAEIACTNDNGATELLAPLGKLVDYDGVPVRFFPRYSPTSGGRLAHMIREFQISLGFYNWLKSHIATYDVVHVHALFSFTSSFTMRLARKRGIRYIAHPIGSLEKWSLTQSRWRKTLFLAALDKANLNAASLVHYTAHSELQQAKQVTSNPRNLVLPLGIDLPTLQADARQTLVDDLNLSAPEPIILYLGRLHKKKGLELLLAAAGEIKNQAPQVLIAGDGDPSYRVLLMNLVSDLGLEDRVHFLGHVSGQQKQALLQGADLLALTSYAENFAIVVAEALAAGTPVLVTNTVGIAEHIANQGVGSVCEPDKDAVLEALKALLADQPKLAQMGEKARELAAKQFDWAQIAIRLKAAYEGCLNSPR